MDPRRSVTEQRAEPERVQNSEPAAASRAPRCLQALVNKRVATSKRPRARPWNSRAPCEMGLRAIAASVSMASMASHPGLVDASATYRSACPSLSVRRALSIIPGTCRFCSHSVSAEKARQARLALVADPSDRDWVEVQGQVTGIHHDGLPVR